jgi:hypothetical protein
MVYFSHSKRAAAEESPVGSIDKYDKEKQMKEKGLVLVTGVSGFLGSHTTISPPCPILGQD